MSEYDHLGPEFHDLDVAWSMLLSHPQVLEAMACTDDDGDWHVTIFFDGAEWCECSAHDGSEHNAVLGALIEAQLRDEDQ